MRWPTFGSTVRGMVHIPADWYLSDRVNQAAGMISIQAACDIHEATGRLKIRAKALGESLDHVALDVIDGIVRFHP